VKECDIKGQDNKRADKNTHNNIIRNSSYNLEEVHEDVIKMDLMLWWDVRYAIIVTTTLMILASRELM
jgi:hypothetical protein